jgi:hypothetical protein
MTGRRKDRGAAASLSGTLFGQEYIIRSLATSRCETELLYVFSNAGSLFTQGILINF